MVDSRDVRPVMPPSNEVGITNEQVLDIAERLKAWRRFPLHRLEFAEFYGADVEVLLMAISQGLCIPASEYADA